LVISVYHSEKSVFLFFIEREWNDNE